MSSWTFYIKPQRGNLMLNSDAPSTARLKSQPEPSSEAKLEHPSVNRSSELIYFFRCVMDPLIGANGDPRPQLACSCTHRTRRPHPKYTKEPRNSARSRSVRQQPGPSNGKHLRRWIHPKLCQFWTAAAALGRDGSGTNKILRKDGRLITNTCTFKQTV